MGVLRSSVTVRQIVYVVQMGEVRNASVYCKLPLQSLTSSFVFWVIS